MIKVLIKKKSDLYESINISGHANFDNFGKDIVCAAVSSIVITSVNAIIRLDSDSINYDESNGIYISILKHNKITDTLIYNMVNLLKELEKQYKKNIIVSEEAL